jgi:hypothetical protein
MKRLLYITSVLALTCCATPAKAAITLDGLNIPSEAWSLKSTQLQPTQFGDNGTAGSQASPGGSEIDQFFANYSVADNKLQIGITGNLEQNYNRLYIFFDGQAGGDNVLAAGHVDGFPVGIGNLANRITFPGGVTMDHGLEIAINTNHTNGGFTIPQNQYDVHYFNLINNTSSVVATGAGVPALPLANAGGPNGIKLGWDNSNVAGVTGADASGANSATTGFEFEIDGLTAFNGLQGVVNMVAFVAGDDGAYLSNQSLPSFTSATNIGGGTYTYTGVISVSTTSNPGFPAGDVDHNNLVNLADFQIIRANWLATSASLGHLILQTEGDLNQNGIVDIQDFREWKTAFGGGSGAAAGAFASLPPGTAPEPSSILLAWLAGWGLLIGATRHRS